MIENGTVNEARSVHAATAHAAGSASTVSAAVSETVTMMTATVNGSAARGNAAIETVSASMLQAVLGVVVIEWRLPQGISCCLGEFLSCTGNTRLQVIHNGHFSQSAENKGFPIKLSTLPLSGLTYKEFLLLFFFFLFFFFVSLSLFFL